MIGLLKNVGEKEMKFECLIDHHDCDEACGLNKYSGQKVVIDISIDNLIHAASDAEIEAVLSDGEKISINKYMLHSFKIYD